MCTKHYASSITAYVRSNDAQHEGRDRSAPRRPRGRQMREHSRERGKQWDPHQHENADGHIPQVILRSRMPTVMEQPPEHQNENGRDKSRYQSCELKWPGKPYHRLAHEYHLIKRQTIGILTQPGQHFPHCDGHSDRDHWIPSNRTNQ